MSSTTLPVCPKTGSTSPSLTVHLCLHTAPEIGNAPHPNQVGTWKRQAIEGLDEVFARGGSPGPSEHEATIRDLHAKIGELTMERDFFQRGLQR